MVPTLQQQSTSFLTAGLKINVWITNNILPNNNKEETREYHKGLQIVNISYCFKESFPAIPIWSHDTKPLMIGQYKKRSLKNFYQLFKESFKNIGKEAQLTFVEDLLGSGAVHSHFVLLTTLGGWYYPSFSP